MENKPIFVKIDEYKDIQDVLGLVKAKINDAHNAISRIESLKKHEEAEIEMWKSEIEHVSKRINAIEDEMRES